MEYNYNNGYNFGAGVGVSPCDANSQPNAAFDVGSVAGPVAVVEPVAQQNELIDTKNKEDVRKRRIIFVILSLVLPFILIFILIVSLTYADKSSDNKIYSTIVVNQSSKLSSLPITFLTNFNIECPANAVLTSLTFISSNSNYNYKFSCMNLGSDKLDSFAVTNPQTDLAGDLTNSLHYLDRQNVQCSKNYGINKQRLFSINNKIYYTYTCLEVKNSIPSTCSDKYTTRIGGSYNLSVYPNLVLNVKTTNEYLTRFRLNSIYSPAFYYQYQYTSCSIETKK